MDICRRARSSGYAVSCRNKFFAIRAIDFRRSGWIAAYIRSRFRFFYIFTALIIGQTSRAALYASLTWFFIDISFEIGQHAAVAPSVASALSPIGSFTSYFTAGTFDPLDMASIGVGAALAYIFVSASFVSHKSTAALKKLQ